MITDDTPGLNAYFAWINATNTENTYAHLEIFLAGWNARGLSAAEIGSKGGRANLAKHGRAQMATIGKMGGDTIAKKHGPEFYARIGKLGGKANLTKHGKEHLSAIGRRGGQSVVDHLGKEHLRAAGKIGGAARWANKEETP